MTRTGLRLIAILSAAASLALSVGCASSGGTRSDTYYRRGSIHADSFPGTYGRGPIGYGRYGGYY